MSNYYEESSISVLRVKIDGSWTVSDFSEFYEAIEFLSRVVYIANTGFESEPVLSMVGDGENVMDINGMQESEERRRNLKGFLGEKNFSRVSPNEVRRQLSELKKDLSTDLMFKPLIVKKINFASPGFIDIVGLTSLLLILFRILKYYVPNKLDREEAKIKEAQRIKLQIENILTSLRLPEKYVEDIGYKIDDSEAHLRFLTKGKQITDVSISEDIGKPIKGG